MRSCLHSVSAILRDSSWCARSKMRNVFIRVHLALAVRRAIRMGYADTAYVYARLLARYVADYGIEHYDQPMRYIPSNPRHAGTSNPASFSLARFAPLFAVRFCRGGNHRKCRISYPRFLLCNVVVLPFTYSREGSFFDYSNLQLCARVPNATLTRRL